MLVGNRGSHHAQEGQTLQLKGIEMGLRETRKKIERTLTGIATHTNPVKCLKELLTIKKTLEALIESVEKEITDSHLAQT